MGTFIDPAQQCENHRGLPIEQVEDCEACLAAGAEIPEGSMLFEGEIVDADCYCDGSDDGCYACTYPPCVAERDAEMNRYAIALGASSSGHDSTLAIVRKIIANDDDAYEPGDPKRSDYLAGLNL